MGTLKCILFILQLISWRYPDKAFCSALSSGNLPAMSTLSPSFVSSTSNFVKTSSTLSNMTATTNYIPDQSSDILQLLTNSILHTNSVSSLTSKLFNSFSNDLTNSSTHINSTIPTDVSIFSTYSDTKVHTLQTTEEQILSTSFLDSLQTTLTDTYFISDLLTHSTNSIFSSSSTYFINSYINTLSPTSSVQLSSSFDNRTSNHSVQSISPTPSVKPLPGSTRQTYSPLTGMSSDITVITHTTSPLSKWLQPSQTTTDSSTFFSMDNLQNVTVISSVSDMLVSSSVALQSSTHTSSSHSSFMVPPKQTSALQSSQTTYSSLIKSSLVTAATTGSTASLIYHPVFPPAGRPSTSHPPLHGLMNPPPCLSTSGGCCTHALEQIPGEINFEESEPAGTILAEMKDVANVSISVKVSKPASLQKLLAGVYNVTSTGSTYNLVLTQSIDLEDLYDKAGDDAEVNQMQLKLECLEWGHNSLTVPPRYVNVTVDDVDDTLPYFDHPDSDSSCVVPIYSADTSEEYMGELSLKPGTIRALDGDVTSQNNISYTVIHSEPDDYYIYFDLDTDTGSVNKTRRMNASEHGKYVLFVKASEDSPQQKSRVAVLSIVVVAPSNPRTDGNTKVNPNVKLGVQIASTLVLMAFMCAIIVVIHHRYRLKHTKVRSSRGHLSEERVVPLPKLAIYRSRETTLDIRPVTSPSQVSVGEGRLEVPVWDYAAASSSHMGGQTDDRRSSVYSNQSQKKRKLIVKKPIDTALRPGWNAPPPKPKRMTYNPFNDWNKN